VKLLLTNRVNIAAISTAIYISMILSEIVRGEDGFMNSLAIGLFGSLFAIFGYGFIFWVGFLIAICVLDLILIVIPQSQSRLLNLNVVLVIEWVVISIPLVLWAVTYGIWLFIVGSLAFLASQLLWRKRLIMEVIREQNPERNWAGA
jgi:hypothetical protein